MTYILKGEFLKVDSPTKKTGRTYPREVVESAVNRYQKIIDNDTAIGELDHDDSTAVVSLSKASHKIKSLKIKGESLIGEIEVLDIGQGKNVIKHIENGGSVGVTLRAFGLFDKGNDKAIVEQFDIITFDLDLEPTTPLKIEKMAEQTKADQSVQGIFNKWWFGTALFGLAALIMFLIVGDQGSVMKGIFTGIPIGMGIMNFYRIYREGRVHRLNRLEQMRK